LEVETGNGDGTDLVVERYGGGLELDVGLTGAELGTFIHRCFEVLGARPDLKERMPQVTGIVIEPQALETIALSVKQFEDWLQVRLDPESLLREWPILALNEDGSVVSGMVDLIVETRRGVWVIDHKSDLVEDPVEAFGNYRAQLETYAAALAREGKTVLGVAINWTRGGVMVFLNL
jgi:ATP-dependent exoDNAse (exonuclease V) beta subunit